MLIRNILTLLTAFLIAFTVQTNISYADDIPKIRVALDRGTITSAFRVTDGNFDLIDKATGLTIGKPLVGEKWTFTLNGTTILISKETQEIGAFTGPIILQPTGNDLNVFSYNNIRYRDLLTIEVNSSKMLVVNIVDLEKYLYGVVGKEMGYGAPEEALKTQAVVSRSFALASKGSNLKYDVTNDTSSQVFGGYSAELVTGAENVKRAVDETAGEVIYYYDAIARANKIVKAYFHANAGGYTEDSEYVWSASLPYIKAVDSSYDKKAPEYSYKWIKTFTKDELQQQIDKWNNLALSKNQSYNIVDVGDVSGIYAFNLKDDGVSPTTSGRITRLDIVGDKGTKSFFKDTIRSVFGLKSTKFTVSGDSSLYVLGPDANNSQAISDAGLYVATAGGKTTLPASNTESALHVIGKNETVVTQQGFTSITFNGYGYGHGLGMSQWGARGMADAGYNYKEIVEHYYNQDKNDGRLTISINY